MIVSLINFVAFPAPPPFKVWKLYIIHLQLHQTIVQISVTSTNLKLKSQELSLFINGYPQNRQMLYMAEITITN